MISDIRQSPEFASFMTDLGWQAQTLNGQSVYLKKFPLIGSFAKCPRPDPPLSMTGFTEFIKKHRIFNFKIAPNILTSSPEYLKLKKKLLKLNFRIEQDPYNPTTTILVDLTRKEEDIFKSFSEAKRRAVRRAVKNGIKVSLSDDINAFIKIRQQQFKPMGFLISKEMQMLMKNFYPKKADLLLAQTSAAEFAGGILLLYHNRTAYYWYASALKEGKKLFAPTILVWEAIKQAKKRNCRLLDFEGIYDERFPKASQRWRGFTKFKEGFSDKKITYMENFSWKKYI